MCGIAGFKSNRFSERDLKEMTFALGHRGPDAEGYYFYKDDGIGLGHKRLSIIDLSAGANQPFIDSSGNYFMVYNGEVYNYQEISEFLQNHSNFIPRTNSDTEIVLESFKYWGVDFVQHLNGMFAIAIWDKVNKKLLLFRDRFGIKPLYYYFKDGVFAFASEVRSIAKLTLNLTIDKFAIKEYLNFEYIPGNLTVYSDVKKIKPGHLLSFQNNRINENKWYNIFEKIKPNKSSNLNFLLEEFDGLLEKSIKRRMITDVSIGAFLSGGVDSSIICGKFQKLSSTQLNTFTIGFEEPEFDESRYAKIIADSFGTNHTLYKQSIKSILPKVEQYIENSDLPFASSSLLPMTEVSRISVNKSKVILSGDGGDELFMGYGYYDWINRAKQIAKLPKPIRNSIYKILNIGLSKRYKHGSRYFNLEKNSEYWIHLWSQTQEMFTSSEASNLINQNEQTLLLDNWKEITEVTNDPLEQVSFFDLLNYLPNNLLYKVDTASMLNSQEVRVPFLDHEIVEFAINIDSSLKANKKEKKIFLKKYLEKQLPRELIYRKKWGFPAPIKIWLSSELRYLIDTYLSKKEVERSAIFNFKQVSKLVCEFKSGKNYHYKRVWALICFQIWFKKNIIK